jgi:hypothetical protein
MEESYKIYNELLELPEGKHIIGRKLIFSFKDFQIAFNCYSSQVKIEIYIIHHVYRSDYYKFSAIFSILRWDSTEERKSTASVTEIDYDCEYILYHCQCNYKFKLTTDGVFIYSSKFIHSSVYDIKLDKNLFYDIESDVNADYFHLNTICDYSLSDKDFIPYTIVRIKPNFSQS